MQGRHHGDFAWATSGATSRPVRSRSIDLAPSPRRHHASRGASHVTQRLPPSIGQERLCPGHPEMSAARDPRSVRYGYDPVRDRTPAPIQSPTPGPASPAPSLYRSAAPSPASSYGGWSMGRCPVCGLPLPSYPHASAASQSASPRVQAMPTAYPDDPDNHATPSDMALFDELLDKSTKK